MIGAQAPSNIAIIKYMGKRDGGGNLPENSSLSMTLGRLCTFAEASWESSADSSASSRWVPELPRLKAAHSPELPALILPKLKEEGIAKVTRHVERVRAALPELSQKHGFSLREVTSREQLVLRTANTFPEASGIASSASSFAAITLVAAYAHSRSFEEFERAYAADPVLKRALARLSRQGSGSSCRSFEGPWVAWKDADAAAVPAQMPELAHFVIVVAETAKRVSSSEAHARVKTSPLWNGRIQRAEERLGVVIQSLAAGDWQKLACTSWSEAWEMHSLFHTSAEPFSYWEPGTMKILQALNPVAYDFAPIITLDAGPNVHVIVRASEAGEWKERFRRLFPEMALLEDRPGLGARVIREGGV